MDPSNIFLAVSLGSLISALALMWTARLNAACTRNAPASMISIGIQCDSEKAQKAIRELTADAKRLNAEIDRAIKALPKLQVLPVVSMQLPPRRSPPSRPPMQDETMGGPRKAQRSPKKKPAKR